tara:strand:- start:1153 stop:2277 length:1125 start_codon:yes stop_codon:yes gene_type:complete
MPYIGKSPSSGVRQRYQYTATAGQTTFSGTDLGNLTLTYTDNNFLDCFQNGVLLKGGGTDYTATSGTSVVLATGASVNDVIEIIVYDVFSVGNFYNRTDSDSRYALTTGATMSGSLDLNGTELILDADGDTSITADTDDQIDFKIGGTDRLTIDSSGNLTVDGVVTVDRIINATTSSDPWLKGVDSGNTETLFVKPNGDMSNAREFFNGCNTTPSSSVSGNLLRNIFSRGACIFSVGNYSSSVQMLIFMNSNGNVGNIVTSGSGTSYNTSSDYRLKENVVTDWDATTRLKQLKPSRFNFKADKDTTVDGFLAHEVASIVPEAISGEKDEVDKEGNPEYQGIDQSKLVPLLTKALQEAVAKIETLEAKVTALEGN